MRNVRAHIRSSLSYLATIASLLVATAAVGQVDWSDLFPEEGAKPAAKAAPAQAPAPAVAVPTHQNRAAQQPVNPESRPATHRQVMHTKPARRVAIKTRPQSDREFPAAGDVAAPQFDRHSRRRSSPPPASMGEEAPALVTDNAQTVPAPERAIVKAEPATEPASVAVREPRSEPVAPAHANKVERPVAHESAPAAVANIDNAPLAQPVAPSSASGRAARAVAAQQARPQTVDEDESPHAGGVATTTKDAPVQVAALSAREAMTAGSPHNNAPTDSGEAVTTASAHPGDVITEKNMAEHADVLTPGLEWAIHYGLRIKVIAPRRIKMTRPYLEATEKYAGQAKLSDDGLRVINWVAGQPFPKIDPNDPQAAVKIMWNYSYGWIATDDLDAQLFDADTGTIGKNRGMTVERHYMIDHQRRLFYTGRLFVDPKPELPNPDGIRYKESLHPLTEPFDLKGVGGTFYRYTDPNRQDDSWLYLPQLRRVRRLSSAQRSDALFGQDSDVDSYYGYAGNVAWMTWKLLGERTVLAVMHGQNAPIKWQQPEDWMFDEVWEPRQVYVVEGTSKLPQYGYGKRVIYIDKEAYVVAHSDIYDRAGQLWKVWLNSYSFKKEGTPGAILSRYPEEMGFITAVSMLDTQLAHATKAALPSTHSENQECVFFNMGAKSGTNEDFFTVAHLVASGS